MKKSELLARSAIASVLAVGAIALSNAAVAADKPVMEKCAGVAKAGKNDCGTSKSSCAGTSKTDGDKDAWLYLPKGTCEKVIGGKLVKADAKDMDAMKK